MSPELRAAADSFIYDVAMLLHIADLLGEDRMDRRCEATGWTTRQTLGHLALQYERNADALERRLAGEIAASDGFDPEGANAAMADAARSLPRQELMDRALAARRRILAALQTFTPGQETSPIGEGRPPLVTVASWWGAHGSAHALDFVEAAPELGADALVLKWAYHPRPGEPETLSLRRAAMLKQLRQERKDTP